MVVKDSWSVLIPLRDDRVADGQQSEEFAYVRSVRVVGLQILEHRSGTLRTIRAAAVKTVQSVAGRVDGAANGTLLELHDVLRQRARLVRKDVLDLAQFFVQVGRASAGRCVRGGVVHLQIIIDESGLWVTSSRNERCVRLNYESEALRLTWM